MMLSVALVDSRVQAIMHQRSVGRRVCKDMVEEEVEVGDRAAT